MHRTHLYVNLKAIVHNYRQIEKKVWPAKVMVVLKANAYGLGMKPVALALDQVGAFRFGVADILEALELKKTISKPIQILGELFLEEVELAVRHGIICPGSSEKIIRQISLEARKQKRIAKIHYLIDTGMGRLGIPFSQAQKIISQTRNLPNIEIEGIYSHFPAADDPGNPINKKQIVQFTSLAKQFSFPIKHLSNSDGINNLEKVHFDMVRTGINLFGVFDLLGHRSYILKSALTWETKLIANRFLKKGNTIGYGCTHTLKKDTQIGTIPTGYADGIPLALGNKGKVLIEGEFYPIVGKISMDYTTIDLKKKKIQVGTKVTIVGESKIPLLEKNGKTHREITIEDLAKIKLTHPYEIICSIGDRVKRIYTCHDDV